MTGLAAFAVLEILQLLGDVVGAESRETGPLGIGAVAVRAMTGLADRRLGGAGFGAAGRRRPQSHEIVPEIAAAKNPKPLHIAS